jgi:hypothetical protein
MTGITTRAPRAPRQYAAARTVPMGDEERIKKLAERSRGRK